MKFNFRVQNSLLDGPILECLLLGYPGSVRRASGFVQVWFSETSSFGDAEAL
jgi:hypothetical protein